MSGDLKALDELIDSLIEKAWMSGYSAAMADVLERIRTSGKQDLAGWVDGKLADARKYEA